MSVHDFVQQHPWLTGLAFGILVFVLNMVRRLVIAKRRMPQAKRLEFTLHRTARAIRKLGSAKRMMNRYDRIQSLISNIPVSFKKRLLSRAHSDVCDAVSHLSSVLKKVPALGASPDVMVQLNLWLSEARKQKERCRYSVRSMMRNVANQSIHPHIMAPGTIEKALKQLSEIDSVLNSWQKELSEAQYNLSKTVDPAIFNSGGVFRNPFKPESDTEATQTYSVLQLHESKEDLLRVQNCVHDLRQTITSLQSDLEFGSEDFVSSVGLALDELNTCMTQAALPLPESLVTAESPFDSPEAEQNGLLQQIYDLICSMEGDAWAGMNRIS